MIDRHEDLCIIIALVNKNSICGATKQLLPCNQKAHLSTPKYVDLKCCSLLHAESDCYCDVRCWEYSGPLYFSKSTTTQTEAKSQLFEQGNITVKWSLTKLSIQNILSIMFLYSSIIEWWMEMKASVNGRKGSEIISFSAIRYCKWEVIVRLQYFWPISESFV